MLATSETLAIMEARYSPEFAGPTQALNYGETIERGGARFRLAPAFLVCVPAELKRRNTDRHALSPA